MNKEDMDPCECLWNHQLAVQRLLSILRQSQAYCTDDECISTSRLPGVEGAGQESNVLMMMLIFGVVALLYFMRPNSLRQRQNEMNVKARDSDDEPPAPPPGFN